MFKAGDTKDFTAGEEGKLILNFTIPIIVGNFFMQLYNYVDSVIIGRVLGKEALAAVGASTPFIFMLVSVVIGISIGTTIIISQYMGVKDYKNIKYAADSLFIFLGISSIILSALGLACSKMVFRLIELPEELIPYATQYLNIFLLGLIFLFIFNSLSAILRGLGDSKTPLIFLMISSVINIGLDLLFVITFNWGVAGAAWATLISQAAAIIMAVYYVNKRNSILNIDILNLKFNKEIFSKSLKIGLPAGVQQLLVSFGMLAILNVVNGYGTDVIAGFSAASRIEAFVFIIPMNLSIAITSFTGQNYSSGMFDRIQRGLAATIKMSLVASFVILLILSALGLPLMKMFSEEANVINTGSVYLFVLGLSYWIFCVMFTYMGVLRGMGNTVTPMVITLLTLWIIRIPLAHILSEYFGELGIWLSSPASWLAGMIASIYFVQREIKKANSKKINNSDALHI